jgi:predicted ATPase/class 3 adenylate cyclase
MSGISAWLDGLGLGRYATVFVENAIDLDVLPDLNEADLESIGVALGHRKRILRAIADLSKGSSPPTSTSLADVAAPQSEAEKRHLTALFCDIVGSTALAVQLDPEDLSGLIRRFQATCTAIITHNGGYVAKFMGDGILAYFGYPHAHEDDAESAARAGLDLVAKVGQLLLPSNEPLQVRVGIATGLVIIRPTMSEGSAQEQAVFGDTLNLAAGLQSLAPPSSVVIAKSTRDLLGERFVCVQLGSSEVKGVSEPVTVSRITGERAVESRFDAKRSAKLTQFVGRRSELQQLLESWGQVKEGEGQVALLCGEPGIGKSRIAIALFDLITADPHITTRIQCSSHHTRSPFHPVIEQLSRAAGFEREDGPGVKLAKLEAMLSRAGQASLANAALLAALLSIPSTGRYPAVDLTPQRRKDLTIAALIQYLHDLAGTQPVLFVWEDVHWIDPTTSELLSKTIKAIKALPVLFLITYRPEFFPPWLDEPNVKMLRLERLGRAQVEAMISDISGGKKLPPEVFEHIINKTDGVPLFVEELTKTILESGLLKEAGDRYVTQDSLPVRAVPATLHDSLMARLDRLAQIKEIAQIGAALGREFSYRLLAAVAPISGASLRAALAQFAAADLIFARGDPPDATYVFKHALVQDAAYSSLTRSKREQLHSGIANALKEQFSETVETQPELMAHHLEQAGLIEQAIDYLRLAGQRAIERSAHAEAIGHLKHALKLLESLPAGQRTRVAFGLETLLAKALIAARGYAATETKETLLRARTLLDDSTEPSQKFAVLYGLWACYYVGGEGDKLQRAAAELLAEAERHGGTASLCLSHRALGTTYISIAQFDAARQHLERARALYDPQHHPPFRHQYGQDIGATVLCYLSWALWHLGYVEQASKFAAEAVNHAEELAHPFTLAYTLSHARGMLDVFRRRPDNTCSYATLIVSICSEHGYPFWAASGQVLEGWAATCQGDTDKGIELLRAGVAAWRNTGARLWLPIYLALEAEGHSKRGDSGAALRAIEQAIATSKETGEQLAIAEVLRMKARLLAETRRASDDEIEALLMESIEIARRQHARCWELRAACDLACLWQGQGRNIEGFHLLRSIYDQFTEGFDTPDLLGAKAIMDGLKPMPIAKRNGAPNA